MSRNSPEPIEVIPNKWEHLALWERVRKALSIISSEFDANIVISGVLASDIQSLGALTAAAIEENVVKELNEQRSYWDPESKYIDYYFVRQAEIFPDVRLVNDDDEVMMGIELKSWYLLSKEKEPALRFKTTRKACAPWDLFVVYPWVLDNVLSGKPILFRPFIRTCRYVAEYRNYWWEHVREAETDKSIRSPDVKGFYPKGREEIEDRPSFDNGGNFGRIARTTLMDSYKSEVLNLRLSGIKINSWINFFKREGKKDKALLDEEK
jgi:hypothetical protein